MASCKNFFLSKGGQLTLTKKSTLSSVPVYYLLPFSLPAGLANRLEKIQLYFIFMGEEQKFYSVNGNVIGNLISSRVWG